MISFDQAATGTLSYTGLPPARLRKIYDYTAVAPLGPCAEVGVYRGGSSLFIARLLSGTGQTLYACDTFEGTPDIAVTGLDDHCAGDFADTSQAEVADLLSGLPATLVPGVFPGSATAEMQAISDYSIVHVDADLYQSVLDACEFFWPRMARYGAMIFDDYDAPDCRGAKKAVDEFFKAASTAVVYLGTGQAVAVRD